MGTQVTTFVLGIAIVGTAMTHAGEQDAKVLFNLWFVSVPDSYESGDLKSTRSIRQPFDNGNPIVLATAVGEPFDLEGYTLMVKDGVIVRLDDVKQRRDQVELLAAPALLTIVGQEAEIAIGERIPYMVLNEDGTLTEKFLESATEGVTVRLLADEATDLHVSVERLDIEFRRVIDREPIAGVTMRVGRPVIKTTTVSTAMVLSADRLTVVALPSMGENPGRIFAIIGAKRQD